MLTDETLPENVQDELETVADVLSETTEEAIFEVEEEAIEPDADNTASSEEAAA